MGRETSDEHDVLDLCDEILNLSSLRQHRFEWLRGDPSPSSGRAARLPVDAYWEELGLVVEFRESQHYLPTPFFDKPARMTISGVHRGEQRRRYDERRDALIPEHGLRLVIIRTDDFETRGKRIRRQSIDRRIVEAILAEATA